MTLSSWLSALRARCLSSLCLPTHKKSGKRRNRFSQSLSYSEVFETRTLPAVSVLLVGTTLEIQSDAADSVTVQSNAGGDVEVFDQSGLISLSPSVSAASVTGIVLTGSDSANTFDLQAVGAAFSSLTSIEVSLGDGADTYRGSLTFGDSVRGGDGDDTLFGEGGDDTIDGGHGADRLDGHTGNDVLDGNDGSDTIVGQQGADTIFGGDHDDSIDGGSEDDSISAGHGEDSVDGSDGNDFINGESGEDTLTGNDGNDSILGGDGHDSLLGSVGDDTLSGQAGNDTADGQDGNDSLLGDGGFDSLLGSDGADTINGGSDNDTVLGGFGNDSILGGSGNDSLNGEGGDDIIRGQGGNDTILGSFGSDSLDGNAGNDLVQSGEQLTIENPAAMTISDVTINEAANSVTVFSSNFDSGLPPEFSGFATITGVQGFAGLGPVGNTFGGNLLWNNTGGAVGAPNSVPQTPTTLTLTNLPAHSSIDINFLLAIINSFNGLGAVAFANDFFNVRVDGNVVFRPNFENNATPNGVQGYNPPPGVTLTPQPLQDLGFGPEFNRVDSAWNVGLDAALDNIPHSASTLTIDFFCDGTGFEGGDNESWGIDNLEVILNGTTTATFTVSLSHPLSTPVTVDYATADGTANAGSDYVAVSPTTLTIPANSTSQQITVTVFDDATNETPEDFLVNLSNVTGGAILADSQAVGTIINDDPPPPQLFGIGTQDSPGQLFRIDQNTAATLTVGTVNVLNMIGLTADQFGNLYTLNPGSNQLFRINPYTGAATSIATLSPVTNFVEGDLVFDQFSNTIYTASSGGPPVISRINVATGAVTTIGNLQTAVGTNITGTVDLDGLAFRGPALYGVITGGATNNDSGLNDNLIRIDRTTGVLTNVGDLGVDLGPRAGMTYDRINDVFYVSDAASGDLFRVNPVTGVATRIGPTNRGNVTGVTMADVPAAPAVAVSIADASLPAEGNVGTTSLSFNITLAAPANTPTVVTYTTVDGTAVAGVDYQTTSGSVTFTPGGSLTQTISVPVTGDELVEIDETFLVVLTNITGGGAILNRTTATGVIVNDDAPERDTLFGSDGNDILLASLGDDFINGNLGSDSIQGLLGNDSILGGGGPDTINGGEGNDTIDGQGGNDLIEGSAGDDLAVWNGAADGNDTLTNTTGYDTVSVNGTAGADTLAVGKSVTNLMTVTDTGVTLTVPATIGRVLVNGQAGIDTITVSSLTGVLQTALIINGGDGDDVLSAVGVSTGGVRLRLNGDAGNDSLTGSASVDTLDGGDGDDTGFGGLGNDVMLGGAGVDRFNGEAGDDTILGGDGNDVLRGFTGNDSILGESGDDTVLAGDGGDTVSGGAGMDNLSGEAGNDSLLGNEFSDTISGGDGADTIDGGTEADSITGDLGDDLIRGNHGADTIDGGDGNDSVIGGDGNDVLSGGIGNDAMNGGDGNDTLNGGAGRDSILGGNGHDILLGGADADVLLGGDGDDTLNGQGSIDTIAGNEGLDVISDLTLVLDENFTLPDTLLAALS